MGIDVGKQPSWDFGVRAICIGKRGYPRNTELGESLPALKSPQSLIQGVRLLRLHGQMGSILDRVCHTSRNLPLARIGQFDRTNNGVHTSHGLKGERGRIFRKLTDLLPLALFASAPKYSLVRRYSSGNHAKSCLPRVALSQPP
jgi:hypothetical protein